MRAVTVILVALLLVLQYPLWLGKGGWLKVWDLNRQVKTQQRSAEPLRDLPGLHVQSRLRQACEAPNHSPGT